MDTKQLLLGTLAGTVTSFIAGFLLFGLALTNYMAANSGYIAEGKMEWIITGHVVFSLFVTYIFLKWAGIKTLGSGLSAGAVIGLLVTLGTNAFLLGATEMWPGGLVPALVDTAANVIVWAAGGAGVGWALGRFGGE